ncbi:hypothetical protein EZV73_25535 [Acidaminobacter sp. JC074]|uniref:hypothetical protein n=1 Tax=Acidaminobacter sp. JC074 TaxID=2530199 RepID=UPI001F0D5D20|nr:hypothetical protein [Acidaminobacter sp. JC074]MCH4890966.1 hypothetical protein [Acidaminobacter sp. JC074]
MYRLLIALICGYLGMWVDALFTTPGPFTVIGFMMPFLIMMIQMDKEVKSLKLQQEETNLRLVKNTDKLDALRKQNIELMELVKLDIKKR